MFWPLLLWLHVVCWGYGVDPEFALRVAKVESGCKGQEIRLGRLGRSRYFGPMGLDQDFLRRWRIDLPAVNIAVGVRALRGRDKVAVLKRYNPKATREYLAAVLGR